MPSSGRPDRRDGAPVNVSLLEVMAAALALWLLAWLVIALAYRRELRRIVAEPVFRYPVLVLESDDWGAGPLAQVEALRAIARVLGGHHDASGRPAVMSLALVLAVPDGESIRQGAPYTRMLLDDARLQAVRDALCEGESVGVFSLQLHGMEHYWPPALTSSADPDVQAWLREPAPATTEHLPSHLQSRWVDASTLPTRPLSRELIDAAVADECRLFRSLFGRAPAVVVPPTFVWTRDVEAAWAAQGVACIVTPGWRYTLRGADGLPAGDEGPILQGGRAGALTYLVRCDYFEPLRGRGADHALAVLERQVRLGQPCVLENHRDNFIGDAATAAVSLGQLERLCRESIARHPGLRYLSSQELAQVLSNRDAAWLRSSMRERLPFWWQRLRLTGRPWKLLCWTGAAALAAPIVMALSRPGSRGESARPDAPV